MKIIKLTSLSGGNIFINIEMIGHMYEVKESIEYGKVIKEKHTRIGVTTHNNGGFEAKETTDQIIKLINN
jgi:hypothetical protein